MSQPNTIEQLNEQLATANAALEEALENGGDSTAPRYQIGLIEAEIAATVRRRREEKAEPCVMPAVRTGHKRRRAPAAKAL